MAGASVHLAFHCAHLKFSLVRMNLAKITAYSSFKSFVTLKARAIKEESGKKIYGAASEPATSKVVVWITANMLKKKRKPPKDYTERLEVERKYYSGYSAKCNRESLVIFTLQVRQADDLCKRWQIGD